MKFTGHSDYKSMKPYIDITESAKHFPVHTPVIVHTSVDVDSLKETKLGAKAIYCKKQK